MKINGYAMSLLLGIAFTSTAGAQCPIKDSIMGVGRSFETYDARSTDQRGERPDAMTGATEQHHGADGQVNPAGAKLCPMGGEYDGFRRFRLGGYGEMVSAFKDYGMNRFYGHPEGSPKESRATISIPRFVLALDYKFSPKWVLGAEIEFESGGTGTAVELERAENGEYETELEKGGEVAIEQFHLTRLIHPAFNVRVGHMIVPVGLTNAHHEPMNFFGTVRPEGESTIIPCTWHETGLAFFGSFGKRAARFNYQAMVVSGLNANGFDRNNWVQKGKQGKFEEDRLQHPAFVARLDWTGVSGLRAGVSYYYCDNAGGNADISTVYNTKFPVNIFTVDAQYVHPYVIARANVLTGNVGNAGELSLRNGKLNKLAPYTRLVPVAKRAVSYAGEVGLNLRNIIGREDLPEIIPFARYEYYNAQEEGDKSRAYISVMDQRLKTSMWVFGLNYRVGNGIVVKADYTTRRIGGGQFNSENEFALGVAFNAWFLNK